ncbi:hypothetical protein I317_07679 [Kwoniella heveanensis CBS 569]|nr:hypothetical protein I317_07679 [Kwoniella heveanensis CBS 569]
MLALEEILRTAHKEHDQGHGHGEEVEVEVSNEEIERYIQTIKTQLQDESAIPAYSKTSAPLSLVSFKCLLQDTGYPMEVYLPGSSSDAEAEAGPSGQVDWTQLKERWVGWGVEIPGEQEWSKKAVQLTEEANLERRLDNVSLHDTRDNQSKSLPKSVHSKYPLPGKEGAYLGALIKVYDDVSFKPASVHDFIGVLSESSLPSNEPETADLVPTLHVLKVIDPSTPSSSSAAAVASQSQEEIREDLIDHLATAFDPPDRLAATYLLLTLLSSPTSRPTGMSPVGTLAVNFRRRSQSGGNAVTSTSSRFHDIVSSVTPHVVPLPLTIPLLHSHSFYPISADSSSLDAGLLQLAHGTVLIIDEDGMGNGGQLNENALKNLRALAECVTEQKVRYEYPYMEGLKMECATRVAVLSQGKTLMPVDISISLTSASPRSTKEPALDKFRSYLAHHSSSAHASRIVIPDETAQLIQDDFVASRREKADEAEEALKRRMKVARLLALSYSGAELTKQVWEETVRLDQEVYSRGTLS